MPPLDDETFLRRSLAVARHARRNGNHPFGAILVSGTGEILLEAENVPGGGLAVVIGIGTNVLAAPEGTPTPATSLAALGIKIGAAAPRNGSAPQHTGSNFGPRCAGGPSVPLPPAR